MHLFFINNTNKCLNNDILVVIISFTYWLIVVLFVTYKTIYIYI